MHEETKMKCNMRMRVDIFSNVLDSQTIQKNVPLRMETTRNHALNPKPKTLNPNSEP